MYNAFGQPDLLDDVTDHWSSAMHAAEKGALLTLLRDVAAARRFRWTIVSGDVHLCAVTYLQSAARAAARFHALDPAFIPQLVTSGIGNKPPGDLVVKYIHTALEPGHRPTPELREAIVRFFDGAKTPSSSECFNNRQNFLELSVRHNTGIPGAPSLAFEFVILGGDPIDGDSIGERRGGVVPPLLAPDAGPARTAALQFDVATLAKRSSLARLACCAACGQA